MKFWPEYILVEMLQRHFKSKKFFHGVAELFGWDYKETAERIITDGVLPNQKERTEDIQLRITTGLEKKRDHMVFEISSNGK